MRPLFKLIVLFTTMTFILVHSAFAQVYIIVDGEEVNIAEKGGTVPSAVWQFSLNENPKPIHVCWENFSEIDQTLTERVRAAVGETWEAHSQLEFFGWQQCADSSAGIRILVQDSGPHTKGLGRKIKGKEDGMVLNFEFNYWRPACQQGSKEDWILDIAVHEFGHAIGFTHEHNRDDTPIWCKKAPQGTDPTTYLTPWDGESEMNYCHCDNDYLLSEGDIASVKKLYGAP